jgi:hypothetical protein
MKSQELRAKRLCFFGTEHARGKRGDLAFRISVCERRFKIRFRIPKMEVKELPRFNAVGKRSVPNAGKPVFTYALPLDELC